MSPILSQKPGKWCAVHVQIAWQIYHHQQKMKVSTSHSSTHLHVCPESSHICPVPLAWALSWL